MAGGTVTVVFTDLVGSTELLARGDEAAEELRRGHFRLLREAAGRHGGREVKNLGDGLMLVFDSALSALACAKQIQQATERQNAKRPDAPLAVRVGMNVGEPLREEDDYFGTPVVVASRLCSWAEGGQVLVSELVRSLVAGRGGYEFRALGGLELKGLAEPVAAAELLWREPEPRTRVRLCGPLKVELEGRSVAGELRGGQTRSLLSYLVTERHRAVGRSELIAMLWPERAPKDPQADLRPILSGLRRALGAEVLEGKDQLRLAPPAPVWVDTEAAAAAVEAARASARGSDWQAVREQAQSALDLLEGGFLPGQEADWIEARRRELEDLQLEALEWTARSALALGGSELAAAQQAARELISRSPYRETGYRYLMEAFAASGNVAEALRVYEELRCLLRDELGTVPAPELQALHERLLTGDAPAGAEAVWEQPPLPPALARSAERGAFVGREPESTRLRGLWAEAREGRPRPVLLAGEPGIGKTRLAAQFAQGVHAEGAIVLYGRCDEEALGGYQPFVEALGTWADECPLAELRARAGPAAAELAGLLPELARRLPDLPTPARADPELERYRLLDAVRELLAALASAAPTLLVLDDLHWADRSTLLMLKHLARAAGPARVLLLGTYRETEVGHGHPLAAVLDDLRREHQYERVSLAGLAEREAAALIASRAGHEPTTEFTRAVHEETEGNPFFIEAVLHHLAESGAVDSGLTATGALSQLGIPEDVKEVIRRRLGHLGEQAARALQIASVVGRDFELEPLEHVAGIEGDALAELLEEAVAARLVEELPGAVGQFRFVHALIRETLYEQLTAARRLRLHRRIGEALEQLHAEDDEPYLPALAHHFCEAAAGGDADKAIGYARRAGEWAMTRLAYEEAAGHYERALEVLGNAVPRDERQRLELLLGLGEAHANAGAIEPGRESFKAAAELARELDDSEALARAALGFGRHYLLFVMRAAFDEELIAQLEDALARLAADPSPLWARILARLAWELHSAPRTGRMAALAEEAVEVAQATDDRAALASALIARSLVLASDYFGPPQERLAVAAEALELSEQSGDNELVLGAHEALVRTLVDVGDFAAVDAEIVAVNRLAVETRIQHYLWYARQWSAMRALMEGRFADAERFGREALAVGRQKIGEEAAAQQFGFQIFTARWLQGELEGLDAGLEAVVERMPKVAPVRAALAALYAELGREGEARAELERQAAGEFADARHDESALLPGFYLAYVCDLFGDAEHAASLYRDLLPYADHWVRGGGASTLCLGPASRPLGLLAATMSSWAEAEEHFEAALRDCARVGARPWLAWTQFDCARMLLRGARSGDRLRARELLAQALPTARELGMKPLAQRAVALRQEAQESELQAEAPPARR